MLSQPEVVDKLETLMSKKLIKRALILQGKIIVWSSLGQRLFNCAEAVGIKLRLVPNLPLEGGLMQLQYNELWDKSKVISKGLRAYDNSDWRDSQ